jgi:LuxR family maltose regulon positive regulatory protein
MHLARADAATRSLDKEGTLHEVKLHELEGSANRWFNTDTMSARVLSTASILWSDPERGLALIDSIADDAGFEASHETPWGPLLIRARAELLVKLGALSRAEPLVVDLLANRDVSASAVPAVRFSLCSGDFDQAVAKADEVIFSPELSLADRAHLYALKAAALQLAGASADQVARAATAACVVCEQASTLVPFAMLPAAVRSILLAQHDQHHGGECYITRARERRAFEGLWDFGAQAPVAVRLTRREEVLLPLLATSATIREIANQQFVSVNTVRKQVVSLRKKLGTSSRGELVRRAHELGLLPAYARMSA